MPSFYLCSHRNNYNSMERISYQELPEGMLINLRLLEDFINTSPLEKTLVELVKLRISQLNGCAYCVDMHHKELKHLKETELRLSSLVVWRETPYFTNKERAVLSFAEALSILDGNPIPDAIYNPLTGHFPKSEIAFLVLAIAQINTWNRLMKVFLFTPGNYEVSP